MTSNNFDIFTALAGEYTQEWFEEHVVGHPDSATCSDDECVLCSYRDCPFQEPLHYHHDRCPACDAIRSVEIWVQEDSYCIFCTDDKTDAQLEEAREGKLWALLPEISWCDADKILKVLIG